jgi:hypothetical protein
MPEKSSATPASSRQAAASVSSPCDPLVLEELQKATHRSHVANLLRRHDVNEVNAAWRQLTPLERSSLLLCKQFDGTIIPEVTDAD